MQPFDDKIASVIKKFSYPMWIVMQDPKIKCTCVNYTTGQANPNCTKCLGTGKKIRIKSIKAAHQPLRYSITGDSIASEYVLYSTYYTLDNIKANIKDIFVDGNDVDVIQDKYDERSDHNNPVYYRYMTAPKKNNKTVFLQMFNKLIKDTT